MWSDLVKQLTCDNTIPWDLLHSFTIKGVAAIDESDYLNACKLLLARIDKNSFANGKDEKLFDRIFLKKNFQTLQVLTTSIVTIKDECYRRDKILNIIQKFLHHKQHLAAAFKKICLRPQQNTTKYEKDDLINLLVNLPSNISNVYQLKTPHLLTSKPYFHKTLDAILQSLELMYNRLKNNQSSYVEFISSIVGRISSSGHANLTYDIIFKVIISRGEKDFVWRRITRRLIEQQNDREIEFIIRPILYNEESPFQVQWVLRDMADNRPKLQYLLSEKFFLINFVEQDRFLVNLLHFLAKDCKNLFLLSFNNILKAWTDERALRHRSFDQQIYLCSALIIASKYLKENNLDDIRVNLVSTLVPNIQIYLKCAEIDVRLTGLYVAKVLLEIIQPNDLELKFDIEEIPSVKRLINLKQLSVMEKTSPTEEPSSTEDTIKSEIEKENLCDDEDDDRDDGSDDDLEPYDMPNEVTIDKTKKPIYLTDCINGLLNKENVEWNKACLESCAELIEKNGKMAEDYAENLCRALLHLDDEFELPQFLEWRKDALIKLCQTCPITVASYIVSEFYRRNVLMSVRMDILEIIAIVSAKISQQSPEETNVVEKVIPQDLYLAEKKWRDVIEERVKTKTKLFTPSKLPKLKTNPFPKFAGYFFFPLIRNYTKCDISINLSGDDYYLLGRLIFTLGVILDCVSQAPITRRMGQDLLQFLWSIRYHIESFVRKAVIFCFCIVVTSVPLVHLMEHMQHELVEFQKWLIDVTNKDLDKECVSRAFTALFLLKTLAEEHSKLDWSNSQDNIPKLSNQQVIEIVSEKS